MTLKAPAVDRLQAVHAGVRIRAWEAAHEEPSPDGVELRQREVQTAGDLLRRNVGGIDSKANRWCPWRNAIRWHARPTTRLSKGRHRTAILSGDQARGRSPCGPSGWCRAWPSARSPFGPNRRRQRPNRSRNALQLARNSALEEACPDVVSSSRKIPCHAGLR